MVLTTYSRAELMKKLAGLSCMTFPPSVYIALGTGISDSGLVGELPTGDYARQITLGTNWELSSPAPAIELALTTTFSSVTQVFGQISSWGVYDSSTGGNCLLCGDFLSPRTYAAGEQAYLSPGDICITLSKLTNGLGFSTWVLESLLKFLVGKETFSSPQLFIGFSSVTLVDQENITGEASLGGYARVEVTDKEVNLTKLENSAELLFTVSGDWSIDLITIFLSNSSSSLASTDLIGAMPMQSMTVLASETVVVSKNAMKLFLF